MKAEFLELLEEDGDFARAVLELLLPHLDLHIYATTRSEYTASGYIDVPDVEYSIGVKHV